MQYTSRSYHWLHYLTFIHKREQQELLGKKISGMFQYNLLNNWNLVPGGKGWTLANIEHYDIDQKSETLCWAYIMGRTKETFCNLYKVQFKNMTPFQGRFIWFPFFWKRRTLKTSPCRCIQISTCFYWGLIVYRGNLYMAESVISGLSIIPAHIFILISYGLTECKF